MLRCLTPHRLIGVSLVAGLALIAFGLTHTGWQPSTAIAADAQGSMLADEQSTLPGRVVGMVSVQVGAETIALPDAVVMLTDAQGHTIGDVGRSAADGRFEIPQHAPGSYRLCAHAAGFADQCLSEAVIIQPDTQALAYAVTFRPSGETLHGRVTLAEGSPCFHVNPAFGTEVRAHVVLNGAGRPRLAIANNNGEFVIGGVKPGAYRIKATCEEATAKEEIEVTAAHSSGDRAMNIVLANASPVIRVVVAQDEQGNALRTFKPGQTVRVVAEAFDPDAADALQFKWTDGASDLSGASTRAIHWKLPDTAARLFLNVEVSDGKGGFAVEQLTVGTSDTGARFLGTVKDAHGKPLPQAAVTVDGRAASIDAEGNFRAAVPEAQRHVVTVKQPGFAPVSKVLYGPTPGIKLSLNPATRLRIDPTKPVQIDQQGLRLSFDADQLVDAQGKAPSGPLNLYLHRYDASQGELPGDGMMASDVQQIGFTSVDGIYLEAMDDQGRRYDLIAGSNAKLSLRMPAGAASKSLRSAMTLARYDEADGTWLPQASARATLSARGDTDMQIDRLSAFALGIPSTDTACLQINADLFTVERPFNLRLHVPGPGPTLRDFTITQRTTLIPFLPAATQIKMDVSSVDAPARPIFSLKATTGPNLAKLPPFPYSGCGDGVNNGFAKISAQMPRSAWLARFVGNEESAKEYYASIGAQAKPTFAKWLQVNGFTSADKANEADFYNPNELGLGRKVNCKRSAMHQACYVTKFGHVGGSPLEAFDDTINNTNPGDTVAMEADRVDPSQPPVVKYYIYRPNGALATNTQFDTSGPKYAPSACVHCHGGAHRFTQGNFVVLDPHAYQYPGVSADSPHGLDKQQEKFRLHNESVAFSHVHSGKYYDFLSSLYPDGAPVGVHKPGSKAIPAPVPQAWKKDAFFYTNVFKPSCVTCHMYQGIHFDTPQDVHSLSEPYVCIGEMPQAMSPMLRLWRTTNPSLVHALRDSRFATGGGCGLKTSAPRMTLVTPSGGVAGGVPIVHKATVTDVEDGAGCCKVRWRSDKDGEIGTGSEMTFTYPTKGIRTITAIATDKDGRMDIKSFTLNVSNVRPKLTVLAPKGTVGYGGFNVIEHKATASDAEDGPNCCQIIWTSDKDGRIGVGTNVEFVYGSVGARRITVAAIDKEGASTVQTFLLEVKGLPPSTRIETPTTDAAIFKNTLTVVEGHGFDVNEPLGLPCQSLTWTSSNAEDSGFPFTGCSKEVSFSKTGKRTLMLTAVDKDGLTGSTTRQVTVKSVPAQSPPIVSILEPHNQDLLDPTTPEALNAAVNPGAGSVSFRWTIQSGSGPEIDIGNTQTLSWIPGNNLPFHCGGNSGVLKLYGTNSKGTGSASINIKVLYPVC